MSSDHDEAERPDARGRHDQRPGQLRQDRFGRVLLDRLDASQLADLSFQRFADLQVASAIVKAAWSAARHLVLQETRPALSDHIAAQEALTRNE
ncbi:hypothetical protein [Streptomyces sp. NPDC059008]|uniref:hypothetical protein n=1 Tax=Streptomyces sp. NPDC059008 TaxID=3346693 RepID=UPI003685E41F